MAEFKLQALLLGTSGALLAASVSPAHAQISGMLTPAPGVICDPVPQRCYDAQGLSLEQIRLRFGAAAERQAERLLQGGIPPRQFLLSNGTYCDVDLRGCWEDGRRGRNPARALSRQLFNTANTPTVGGGISSPQPGVLCDAAAKRCYDRRGLSVDLTRGAYGNSAARKVERDLADNPQTRQFLLSNGVLCDLDTRSCWEDGWRRRNVATVLRDQLFGGTTGSSTGGISSPRRGVLCDAVEKRCYDRRGLSPALTGDTFGPAAERRVERELEAGLPARQFLLSDGSLCDLDARSCWEDGWRRRIVAPGTTAQLFGRQGGAGGDNWNTPQGTSFTGQCRLSRGYQTLFTGNCDFRQEQSGYGSRYVVNLANGARYGFENRPGAGFRIDDGSGNSWPVQFTDRGSMTVFRWADMTLETSQGSIDGRPSLGRTLSDLLEGLFR